MLLKLQVNFLEFNFRSLFVIWGIKLVTTGKIVVIIVGKIYCFILYNRFQIQIGKPLNLNRLNHLIDSFLEGFFPSFGELDLAAIYQGNGGIVVVMVFYDVIHVDEVGLVGTEEMLAGKTVFYVFQNAGQKVLFPAGCDNLGIPPVRNAAQDVFHPQEFCSPGGLNCYSCCAHST